MKNLRNWAGNYTFSASELHVPASVEEIQEIVAHSRQIKVLGTRHSFNGIADSTEKLISLEKLNQVIAIDPVNHRDTVEAGIRYGELCQYLNGYGYAIHNLASLPHITIAGAIATATHGSGDANGNLATIVHSLEMVKADGDVVVLSRDDQGGDFAGAVVGLGGLGIVTKLTLDLVPAFQMTQHVYDNLPLAQLETHFDDIFSSAYSVSLFADWTNASFNQVWVKRKLTDTTVDTTALQAEPEFYGAVLADVPRHPVPGYTGENCSQQLGVPGPWHERLAHFRMDFTPSAGEELQSEYFVSRADAYEALCALDRIREHISPLLFVSEVRTIAEDDLWMSPCYGQKSVAFHFTWKPDWEAVRHVLPLIEKQLEPFHARPHWGKLFTMPPARLAELYQKLPDFQQLLHHYDPQGKFRNAFLHTYIMGDC
ncbi:FAD-binding protein [Paenibacillus pectinilyticus]|uniref:FAD-binding protein n=1 Tax=Paenibacillus pectinilyticus TaxID=512399 RepID=A0A1C0ZUK8_9BACL|nr:FAD-binding protein [Paenibacillus pectinilyticus]OCT11790.1 FAD-binding protein [Paenibacillus pectinilyticus]